MLGRDRDKYEASYISLRTARTTCVEALLLAVLAFCSPFGDAQAVIIEAGDGTGNVTAPPDDPGWANLGNRGGTTGVYLGRRWVLTAPAAYVHP